MSRWCSNQLSYAPVVESANNTVIRHDRQQRCNRPPIYLFFKGE